MDILYCKSFVSGAERDSGRGRGSGEVFNHLRVDGEINFRYVSSLCSPVPWARCVGFGSSSGSIFGAAHDERWLIGEHSLPLPRIKRHVWRSIARLKRRIPSRCHALA